MNITFTKMHGLGNDFMVIDATDEPFALDTQQIQQLSDRHKGIGFDQLLVVAPPKPVEKGEPADFSYRIFNADGSEVEQCGNGVRCFARFVYEKGLTQKSIIHVDTVSGRVTPELVEGDLVKVDMGIPVFASDKIPFKPQATQVGSGKYALNVEGQEITLGTVSMGNPHAVIEVDDIATDKVLQLGKALQTHEAFPNKVNAGFVQYLSRSHIKLRVFERGVGETQACGTGACAAVAVGIVQGRLDEKVRVSLPGGDLTIEWGKEHLYMTGPAITVYEGKLTL